MTANTEKIEEMSKEAIEDKKNKELFDSVAELTDNTRHNFADIASHPLFQSMRQKIGIDHGVQERQFDLKDKTKVAIFKESYLCVKLGESFWKEGPLNEYERTQVILHHQKHATVESLLAFIEELRNPPTEVTSD